MKHYGALLAGANNQVDGGEDSTLTIGANDSLILTAANQSTDGTDPGAGLFIMGGVARRATHVLAADGSELAVSGFGSVNTVTADVPVKGINADGNSIFVNSIISEVHSTGLNYDETGDGATTSTNSNAEGVEIAGNLALTGGGSLTVAGNATITGNLDVTGETNFQHSTVTTYTDTFIELDVSQDRTAAKLPAAGVGGVLVEHSYDAGGGNLRFGGLRFNGAANSGVGQWEYNHAVDMNGANIATTDDWAPILSTAVVESVVGGRGVTVATTGTVDGLAATLQDPIVSLDLTATAVSSTTVAGGGLVLDTVAGNGNDTLGIARAGVSAGLLATDIDTTRTGLANGVSGQVLTSQGNGGFAWSTAAAGNTNTVGIDFSKAITTTFIRVAQTAHGLSTATDTDYNVDVYEDETGRKSQILPEAVYIYEADVAAGSGNGVPGEGEALIGDVFVVFGATTAALNGRIVITG